MKQAKARASRRAANSSHWHTELLSGLGNKSGRDVTLVDVDFSAWPLNDIAVVDALTRWIQLPGRRLRLLGARFDIDRARAAAIRCLAQAIQPCRASA